MRCFRQSWYRRQARVLDTGLAADPPSGPAALPPASRPCPSMAANVPIWPSVLVAQKPKGDPVHAPSAGCGHVLWRNASPLLLGAVLAVTFLAPVVAHASPRTRYVVTEAAPLAFAMQHVDTLPGNWTPTRSMVAASLYQSRLDIWPAVVGAAVTILVVVTQAWSSSWLIGRSSAQRA